MRLSARTAALLVLSASLVVPLRQPRAAQKPDPAADATGNDSLTVEQVVRSLEAKNRERTEALRAFEGTRVYHIQYEGFFGKHTAEMTVAMSYKAPSDKVFTVVSESGSKFLINHVLKELLKGEREATTPQNRARTSLDHKNYDFTLDRIETTPNGPQYVLEVSPKSDYKYLYRGRIWVDGRDFAVTRIDVEPARNPSFWIKKTEVKHDYQKIDDFWLPEKDETVSLIRLGGHALLSIQYTSYKIVDPASPQSAEIGVGAAGGVGK